MTEQIPLGYKKTEIGIIPEDWEVKRLGEVGCIIGGGTPNTNESEYWNGEINWFTPTEIGGKKYVLESKRKISYEGLKYSSAKLLPPGTILFTSRATIGEVAVLKKESATNQGFQSIIPKDKDNEFLYYLLLIYKNRFEKIANGSTFLEISPKSIKNFSIQIPPLSEQRAIARVLSDFDKLIESLDRLIEKKKLIKKGAMQVLLTGKKRLPGFKGEWMRKRLGEVFEIKRGASPRPINRYTTRNGINWIKISDVGNNEKYITKTEIKITNDGAEKSVFVHPNDLLLSNSMSYGRPYISRITGCIHDGWLLLKPKVKLDTEFMYYILRTNEIQKKFNLMAAGSGVNNLKIDSVSIVNVKIPPTPEEQGAIAKILSDMDAEIEALERKKEKYEMMKKGAMELLLTGKIRLKDHINEVLT